MEEVESASCSLAPLGLDTSSAGGGQVHVDGNTRGDEAALEGALASDDDAGEVDSLPP